MGELTADSGMPVAARRVPWLERLRGPLCVLLLLAIGLGATFWLLRQPRSVVEIVPPPHRDERVEASVHGGGLDVERPAAGRLNLNTATTAELEALSGIGPVTARRILDYRTQHGWFVSVEELVQARLVPRATFERLRDQLTVEPPP